MDTEVAATPPRATPTANLSPATVTATTTNAVRTTPPPTTITPATATATATTTDAAIESNNNSIKSPGRAMWNKALQGISKIANLSKKVTALLSSPPSMPMERTKRVQEKQTPPQTPGQNNIINEKKKAKTSENDTDNKNMVTPLAPESPSIIHQKRRQK